MPRLNRPAPRLCTRTPFPAMLPHMATTKQRPLPITEAFTRQPGPLKVDRERGVIYGVRVLGFSSSNNRRYTREGVQRAVLDGHYSGTKIYVDHAPNQRGPRPSRDLFGKLENAHLREDGVYADLHYLTKHPLAESVVEDCERGLGLYGLSHNALAGDWAFDNGTQVVRSIESVTSVDLVSDPATNTNLWEGKAPMKTTLKRFFENRLADNNLPLTARNYIREMYDQMGEELGGMTMDDPTPAAGAPAEAAPDGYSLLHQAIAAFAAAGDEKQHALATKLLKLVKPDGGGDMADDLDVDDDGDDAPDDDKPSEGKKKTPDPASPATLTEAEARDLCEGMGHKASPHLLECVTGLPLAKALKVLRTVREAAPAPAARPPRSQERVTEGAVRVTKLDKLPQSPAALRRLARNLGN